MSPGFFYRKMVVYEGESLFFTDHLIPVELPLIEGRQPEPARPFLNCAAFRIIVLESILWCQFPANCACCRKVSIPLSLQYPESLPLLSA